MLTVSCRGVASDCDFVGRGNSEDELMVQLLSHIVKDHRTNIAKIMKPDIRKKLEQTFRNRNCRWSPVS
jgi:predicted small metal-binding protein